MTTGVKRNLAFSVLLVSCLFSYHGHVFAKQALVVCDAGGATAAACSTRNAGPQYSFLHCGAQCTAVGVRCVLGGLGLGLINTPIGTTTAENTLRTITLDISLYHTKHHQTYKGGYIVLG